MTRGYDSSCPVARTLDIIGERWTMLILRELSLSGPRRFCDFEESLAGIAPNTLSARLKKLQAAGVIERHNYSDHPPRADYRLTPSGEALRPVLRSLKEWGERFPHALEREGD